MANERIGNFHIVSELGRGGMGVVYKVYNPDTNKHYALKCMLGDIFEDEAARERFAREAGHGLEHPNIVTVVHADIKQRNPYIVFEYIDGKTLQQTMHGKDLEWRLSTGLNLVKESLHGLQYMHDQGITHRDLKPQNILIDGTTAKISDFGLIKDNNAQSLTVTGEMIGTPLYMSPEQLVGGPIDARTDIYSMGTILYEVLSGKLPFDATNRVQLFIQLQREPHVPLRARDERIPEDLEAITDRCLQKNRDERYQSARELARDISQYIQRGQTQQIPLNINRRKFSPVLGGIIAAGLAGFGIGCMDFGATPPTSTMPAEIETDPLKTPSNTNAPVDTSTPSEILRTRIAELVADKQYERARGVLESYDLLNPDIAALDEREILNGPARLTINTIGYATPVTGRTPLTFGERIPLQTGQNDLTYGEYLIQSADLFTTTQLDEERRAITINGHTPDLPPEYRWIIGNEHLSSFAIKKHELTIKEYQPILLKMDPQTRADALPQWDGKYLFNEEGRLVKHDGIYAWPNQPVWGLSYYQCELVAQFLRRQTGENIQIPTVDQLDWVRRNGELNTAYPWGDQFRIDKCNNFFSIPFADRNFNTYMQPVGTYDESPLGVTDLIGNVAEWTRTPGPNGGQMVYGGGFRSGCQNAPVEIGAQEQSNMLGIRYIIEK